MTGEDPPRGGEDAGSSANKSPPLNQKGLRAQNAFPKKVRFRRKGGKKRETILAQEKGTCDATIESQGGGNRFKGWSPRWTWEVKGGRKEGGGGEKALIKCQKPEWGGLGRK